MDKAFTISIPNGCERWGVGRTTLYKLLGNPIDAVCCGGRTLVVVDSGDRYFASLPRFRSRKAPDGKGDEAAR